MEILYIEKLASRKDRERAVGAGRKSLIPTGRHKLALILFYLKVYPTFGVLGVFSGINSAECCRWVHKLLPILEQLLGQKQMLPKRKICSLKEFAAVFPQAVEVMIDATERPTRSKKNVRAPTKSRSNCSATRPLTCTPHPPLTPMPSRRSYGSTSVWASRFRAVAHLALTRYSLSTLRGYP
jgi:hypothetical protein